MFKFASVPSCVPRLANMPRVGKPYWKSAYAFIKGKVARLPRVTGPHAWQILAAEFVHASRSFTDRNLCRRRPLFVARPTFFCGATGIQDLQGEGCKDSLPDTGKRRCRCPDPRAELECRH